MNNTTSTAAEESVIKRGEWDIEGWEHVGDYTEIDPMNYESNGYRTDEGMKYWLGRLFLQLGLRLNREYKDEVTTIYLDIEEDLEGILYAAPYKVKRWIEEHTTQLLADGNVFRINDELQVGANSERLNLELLQLLLSFCSPTTEKELWNTTAGNSLYGLIPVLERLIEKHRQDTNQ